MLRRILSHLKHRIRGTRWKAKTPEVWEAEFRAGDWEFLQNLDELAHQSVLVGYYAELKPGGKTLDVGCGYGTLAKKLVAHGCIQYTGIDIAETAIERARRSGSPYSEFTVAPAEQYAPTHLYDVIVFNECLGYFQDPIAVLRHYSQFLEPEGVILISMWENEANKMIWKRITACVSEVDRVRIENAKGTAWNVAVILGLGT